MCMWSCRPRFRDARERAASAPWENGCQAAHSMIVWSSLHVWSADECTLCLVKRYSMLGQPMCAHRLWSAASCAEQLTP